MRALIETKRLWLRPLQNSDGEAIAEAINDFDVSKWLTRVKFPYSLDDAHSFIREVKADQKAVWAIIFQGHFAGIISIENELGYWLAPVFWGKGIMQEACAAVVSEYFQCADALCLGSSYFVGNERSLRVLKQLGFRAKGAECQQYSLSQEKCVSLQKVVLGREDWNASQVSDDFKHHSTLQLYSKRLRYRSYEERDMDAVMAIMSHYDVTKNTLTWQFPPISKQITERMCDKNEGSVALCVLCNENVIAVAGLSSGMLWFMLHPDYWGNGFASEIGKTLLSYAFKTFDYSFITAGAFDDNPASIRVLQKLGGREISPCTLWALSRQGPVTSRNFIFPRSEWQTRHAPVILTKRLKITSMHVSDIENLARIGGDPRVAPMILRPTSPWPKEEAAMMLMQSCYTGRPGYRLGVYVKQSGRFIGCVGLGPDASIAYFFDPDFWGQGIASEAVCAFVCDCFERYGFTALEADHFHDNPASGAVLRKLGFVQNGEAVAASAARKEKEKVLLYKLERSHFETRLSSFKP